MGSCTENTGTVCLQNHGASPGRMFSLQPEVADLSKLPGGMKDSSCRRPGPSFSLWLEAHLAQERNWRYTKVSKEEKSPSGVASSPHFFVSCLLASLI